MYIYGKEVSKTTREELARHVAEFGSRYGRVPCLAVVLVGEDPASQTYVRNKILGCEEVGIRSISRVYEDGTPQETIAQELRALAADDAVDGILVQLPLPKGYDERYLLSLIPDSKDVDGFSPNNLGLLCMDKPRTVSCTPFGVMKLLESTGVSLAGKHAVVVGRSNTVGKPMAMLLLSADCTVTVCHSKTPDLSAFTRQADILVVAAGRPKMVRAEMVKPGAIVIDVGINRVDGKLCGDVDPDVESVASYLTPVPGGVGPMTISMLLYNTYRAAVARENA